MKCKKILAIVMALILVGCLAGCSQSTEQIKKENKITIMTTLFPYYDFVRAIVRDAKNIEIKLLVSPGQDDHSFEPTPANVLEIDKADVFIYNGGTIENWVSEVLQSLDNREQTVIRMMDCVEEQIEENHDEDDEEQIFAVDDHEHNHAVEEHHHEEVDEHIWTSPAFAQILLENICDTLCKKLPEYGDVFRENTKNYVNQIKGIDKQFRDVVQRAEKKEIIFADKFPLKYFADEYGLKYYAAFDGCSGEMEPSAKTVAFLIDKVRAKDVKGIFYLELSSQAMADVICDDTGVSKYQFNSCHNITGRQFDDGVTYVSLMKENIKVLDKALNGK